MINLNKITLSGFLTKDPQLIKIGDGSSVAKARIAYNGLFYTTKGGDKKRDVLFIDLETWGKSGESLVTHEIKGSALLVEGELKQSDWTGDDGIRRNRNFLRVIRWQFALSKKAKEDGKKITTPKTSTKKKR